MTTVDGFLCFIARRRFMAFIGAASSAAAAFFMAVRMAFMETPFIAFFIAAAMAVTVSPEKQ